MSVLLRYVIYYTRMKHVSKDELLRRKEDYH